ncbi:MAG: SCO family protein [Magnetovibrio sp.]|nr:SCO family protein [Magnetovibrio sp.]
MTARGFPGRWLAAGLIAIVLAASPAAAKAPPALPFSFGGAYALTDHTGRAVTDRDFRGRFQLVFFGYTYCPDICPTGLTDMAAALDALGPLAERVQPLFISVDPGRDTPAVLKDYVAHFHPRLIGLTGSEAQVRAAAKAYRVHRSKLVTQGAKADEYLVNHTSITYLMAPDGTFVTLFPHGTKPAFMTKALRKYLARDGGGS